MNRNKLLGRILSGIREDMHELCKKFPLEAGFCFGIVSLLMASIVGHISGVPGMADLFAWLMYVGFAAFVVRFLIAVILRLVKGRPEDADV